ncbi:MAG TPA: HAMP domain-containing protein, partial [Firmicutes bacterium]|nr:HAMP domain-containing protein [Bacillota bacterium]
LRSLKVGIALCCGAPLALALAVYGIFLWRTDHQQLRTMLLEHAKVEAGKVIEQFDLLEAEAGERLPRHQVDPVLAELIEPSEVFDYVSILDRFGRVIVYSKERGATVLDESAKERVYAIDGPRYFADLNEVYYPLFNEERKISGLLRLGVSDHYLGGAASAFLFHALPLGLVTLLVVVGLSSLLAQRFLNRSLGTLIHSVDRVSEGDFTRRVDTFVVRDELIPLSSSLNRLFETIESDKKHIHRLNSGQREFENRITRFKSESVEQLHQLRQRASDLDKQLQILLRMIAQGFIVFEPGGRVLASNSQARRMLRLERQGKDFFLPEQVCRTVARLFPSPSTERAEGAFECEDGVFLKTRQYQLRAERLPGASGGQPVLALLEDSTRAVQMEKEKADLRLLLRNTIWPTLQNLHHELLQEEAGAGDSLERPSQGSEAVAPLVTYLHCLMDDWVYWDSKSGAAEGAPTEAVDPVEILRALRTEPLRGFSAEIQLHLPEDEVDPLHGSREELRRLFGELLLLLQLAVPGQQDSAIDLIAEPERLWAYFRKSARAEQDWSAPPWLECLAGKQPVTQDNWIHLKLNIVRLLADLYGAKIVTELQEHGGRQGVVISLELPVKQSRKSQDTTVDDLIQRFFVAPA